LAETGLLGERTPDQFEKLTNQARFVKMIVDKQLSVSNRKKADIVAELRKKEFRPFPKVSKAKDQGRRKKLRKKRIKARTRIMITFWVWLSGV
jgi:hypothetical protein